jgi:mannan endo-1,4-beta-mannosidase
MYYTSIFEHIYQAAASGTGIAGANFWVWSGEARPVEPYGSFWQAEDPLLGDPPHENQGWYGIYDCDTSTLAIIKAYAKKMRVLSLCFE